MSPILVILLETIAREADHLAEQLVGSEGNPTPDEIERLDALALRCDALRWGINRWAYVRDGVRDLERWAQLVEQNDPQPHRTAMDETIERDPLIVSRDKRIAELEAEVAAQRAYLAALTQPERPLVGDLARLAPTDPPIGDPSAILPVPAPSIAHPPLSPLAELADVARVAVPATPIRDGRGAEIGELEPRRDPWATTEPRTPIAEQLESMREAAYNPLALGDDDRARELKSDAATATATEMDRALDALDAVSRSGLPAGEALEQLRRATDALGSLPRHSEPAPAPAPVPAPRYSFRVCALSSCTRNALEGSSYCAEHLGGQPL